jgi:mRNA-degrading endonuclease YafQ of YafQ-DinJ toxin-antitoxin module
MSNKLIGTDPNQVPSNADLGTLAYQDAYNPSVEKLRIYSPQNTENSLEFKSSHALSKTYKIYNAVGWNPDALLIYNHTDDSTVLTIEPGKLGINRGANSLTRTLEVNGSAWISGALGIGTETSTSVLTVNSNISS